jgi:hypothetical protein
MRRCRLCLLFMETHDSSSVSGIPSSINAARFWGVERWRIDKSQFPQKVKFPALLFGWRSVSELGSSLGNASLSDEMPSLALYLTTFTFYIAATGIHHLVFCILTVSLHNHFDIFAKLAHIQQHFNNPSPPHLWPHKTLLLVFLHTIKSNAESPKNAPRFRLKRTAQTRPIYAIHGNQRPF